MNRKDCALIIFSKAPVPGKVKTRLIPLLGEEGAAELYQSLLKQTLMTSRESEIIDVMLYCMPTVMDGFLRNSAQDYGASLHLQTGNDLGERMCTALEETLKSFRSVLLIGCDCPDLTADDLNTAHEQLTGGYELVIGPADDGGYYLIGTNNLNKSLFDNINWGGPDVLMATRGRVRELGLSCYELPQRWDLDRPEDLERYYNMEK